MLIVLFRVPTPVYMPCQTTSYCNYDPSFELHAPCTKINAGKEAYTHIVHIVSLLLGQAFVAVRLVVPDRWRAAGKRVRFTPMVDMG